MRAEIITSGTELLLGDLIDTNAPYLSRCLRQLGVDVQYRTTVGDNEGRIAQAVTLAMSRAEVVIITGGLGPTVDDVTRQAVAAATARPLELRRDLLQQIEERFRHFGSQMTPNNTQQAQIPAGATAIENPVGTAPGFVVETDRSVVICLPGVPHELEYLLQHWVLPYLRETFDLHEIIRTRVLRTCGVGESRIDDLIGDLMRGANPTIGLNAHPGQTDVRITAKAADEAAADEMIAGLEGEVRRRLGPAIYGTGDETLEGVLAGILGQRGYGVAVLEMPTAGEITHRLARAGRDIVLRVGLVVLRADRLAGVVGLDVCRFEQMRFPQPGLALYAAHWLRARHDAACALAAIGFPSPTGDEPTDSSVAVATPEGEASRVFTRSGRDARSRTWLANLALDLLRRHLLAAPLES